MVASPTHQTNPVSDRENSGRCHGLAWKTCELILSVGRVGDGSARRRDHAIPLWPSSPRFRAYRHVVKLEQLSTIPGFKAVVPFQTIIATLYIFRKMLIPWIRIT